MKHFVRVESGHHGSQVIIGEMIVRNFGCMGHYHVALQFANMIIRELNEFTDCSLEPLDDCMRETMARADRDE